MGVLINRTTQTRVSLRARNILGRSRRNDVLVRDPSVSAEHATIAWRDGAWWIRDLGSRNGTFVDGMTVEAGTPRRLTPGCQLTFGDVTSWSLEDPRGPEARAVSLDGGSDAVAIAGMIALPDEQAPELTLSERPGGSWTASDDESYRVVVDLDEIEVGGRRFRLHLPLALDSTVAGGAGALRVPDLALEFLVSLDEETVDVRVYDGKQEVRLPSRAHSYALLSLARYRMADAHLPPAEQGWVERDVLANELRQEKALLAVQLYRARLQLAESGVLGVGELFERRLGRVRIGLDRLSETPLSG